MLLGGNMVMNNQELVSNESLKQGNSGARRMPRPKPLNTTAQRKKTPRDPAATMVAQDKLQLGHPFGVLGVSPLTQLANNMFRSD